MVVDDYLLPIVSVPGKKGEKLYTHIKNRYKRVNDAFGVLGEELNIESGKITTHVARHSFAMDLKASNVPRDVITELMGHVDGRTTDLYLDCLTREQRDYYLSNSHIYSDRLKPSHQPYQPYVKDNMSIVPMNGRDNISEDIMRVPNMDRKHEIDPMLKDVLKNILEEILIEQLSK